MSIFVTGDFHSCGDGWHDGWHRPVYQDIVAVR